MSEVLPAEWEASGRPLEGSLNSVSELLLLVHPLSRTDDAQGSPAGAAGHGRFLL